MERAIVSDVEGDWRWHVDASDDLVARLLQRRANVNLIRTMLFARVVQVTRPACPDALEFARTVAWLQSIPAGAVSAVMGTPWFDHWIYLADNVRRRYERTEVVPDSDLPSYGSATPSAAPRVAWLLRDFGRFALECAILTGLSYRGSVVAWDSKCRLVFGECPSASRRQDRTAARSTRLTVA